MMMVVVMMVVVVELSRRVDGQASDWIHGPWRTGSDQEALPPQHTHTDPIQTQNISNISITPQRRM